MPLVPSPLTEADFNASGWEQVIAGASRRECSQYVPLLQDAAAAAQAAGDAARHRALIFLAHLASFHLKPDSPDGPFAPMVLLPDGRSASIVDLSAEELDVLHAIAPSIADPELKARAADILWVRRRDHTMAKEAVDAYLASAAALEDPIRWSSGFSRISRAVGLASALGRKNPQVAYAVAHVEALLTKYDGQDPFYFSAKLMELLLSRGYGDEATYAPLAERAARKATNDGDWARAAYLWRVKAKRHRHDKHADEERAASIDAAETSVLAADADEAKQPPNYVIATSHLETAIRELRKVADTKERVEAIHKRLLGLQVKAMGQFRGVGTLFDTTEIAEQARGAVKGRPLSEALLILAQLLPSPRVGDLRTFVLNAAQEFPLQHLIATNVVNRQGKVTGRRPSVLSKDPEEAEAALRAEMLRQASRSQTLDAIGVIEPAREQILLEHAVELHDLQEIAASSSFVPGDREDLFARGLYAGLTGDNVVALHLLLPQVEHTLRLHLAAMGVRTSGYDAAGIQDELDLNALLYAPELKELLGEDIIFDLQGLFVERFGSNLRNLMAHGLLGPAQFLSPAVAYAWWLILRLCCLPILIGMVSALQAQAGQPDTGDGGSEADLPEAPQTVGETEESQSTAPSPEQPALDLVEKAPTDQRRVDTAVERPSELQEADVEGSGQDAQEGRSSYRPPAPPD